MIPTIIKVGRHYINVDEITSIEHDSYYTLAGITTIKYIFIFKNKHTISITNEEFEEFKKTCDFLNKRE